MLAPRMLSGCALARSRMLTVWPSASLKTNGNSAQRVRSCSVEHVERALTSSRRRRCEILISELGSVIPKRYAYIGNAVSVVPLVHSVQLWAEAAFRHDHVNVVREFALYELETGAAFVARYEN